MRLHHSVPLIWRRIGGVEPDGRGGQGTVKVAYGCCRLTPVTATCYRGRILGGSQVKVTIVASDITNFNFLRSVACLLERLGDDDSDCLIVVALQSPRGPQNGPT